MKLPRGILFDLDDTILMAFGPARSQWRRTITAFADRLGPIEGWRRTSAERAHGHALRVWLDEAEIPLGGSIPGHINRGLEISRFALLLMTPAYFESSSGWTDAEWHAALNEDPDNRQHRLIPAMGADCPYIPYLLRHLRGADLRGDKYDNGLREILRALKGEPLPRPVTHRGQLIAPSGKIDRSQLVAERSVLDASPDAISEILQCNLLPVERLPARIWTAPLNPDVLVRKGRGTTTPAKSTLMTRPVIGMTRTTSPQVCGCPRAQTRLPTKSILSVVPYFSFKRTTARGLRSEARDVNNLRPTRGQLLETR
jgi:hypothetical protein